MTEPRHDKQWVAIFATRWGALAKDVCRCGFDLVGEPQGDEWLRIASTVGARRAPTQGQMALEVESTFPYE
jgi:hypothetical protein